jgi:hypothetical protein
MPWKAQTNTLMVADVKSWVCVLVRLPLQQLPRHEQSGSLSRPDWKPSELPFEWAGSRF